MTMLTAEIRLRDFPLLSEVTVNPIKMHADEVDIDSNLAGRLILSQFPAWATLTVAPVALRGTDNALYRLGSNLAARLPRREKNTRQLEQECNWLPKLAPLLPLTVPVPVAIGKPGEGYPFDWAIYRWLDGEPAAGDILDMGLAATDLASFVAALQRVDASGRTRTGPAGPDLAAARPAREPDAAIRARRGIVLIDSEGLHPAMRHLGERLKHATVADDMSVSLVGRTRDLKTY